jgi:hypothetical protein
MYDFGYQKDQMDETSPLDVIERRNSTDRRKKYAAGFAYISGVGWICRREQVRRKDDPGIFTNYDPEI